MHVGVGALTTEDAIRLRVLDSPQILGGHQWRSIIGSPDMMRRITAFSAASALPVSIVDRLLIIEIPAPSPAQMAATIASIYAARRAALGSTLPETLSEQAAAELERHNPRRAGRLLDLAIGYAAAAGRRAVSANFLLFWQPIGTAWDDWFKN